MQRHVLHVFFERGSSKHKLRCMFFLHVETSWSQCCQPASFFGLCEGGGVRPALLVVLLLSILFCTLLSGVFPILLSPFTTENRKNIIENVELVVGGG